MLNYLHHDKKLKGVNRGEMGRSLATTGRMVITRSIGYISEIKEEKKKKKKKTASELERRALLLPFGGFPALTCLLVF